MMCRRDVTLPVGALVMLTTTIACSPTPTATTTATAPVATAAATATTKDPAVPTPTAASRTASAHPAPSWTGGDRPFHVFVPSHYDGAQPMPLVVLLHWLGGTGDQVEAEYELEPLAEQRHFLYVRPNGTKNSWGDMSWNATDACCNSSTPPVDDSAYLASVIEAVKTDYNVDPKRVFVFGISNGGFMAHRMACDHADQIAAIVSVVGSTFLDPQMCHPAQPVSVLEIHGTADETVPYAGGEIIPGREFPGAEQTVNYWAHLDGCTGARTPSGERLDLEATLSGDETVVSHFSECPAGIGVELWTVEGGGHALHITPGFVPAALDFLFAHPRR